MRRRSDLHTLAGAYAMDAVPLSERAEFERHLASCEPCREEVRGLREATALLAAATAVQPSAGFREARLRAAPDAKMMSAPVSTGGTATVVMSHRERALVFTAADLRVLPSSESYELWLMGPAGNKPAGMINVSGSGKMASPMVVAGLSSGDRVGMTVEPAGGSPHPTTPLVVVIVLSGT